MDSFNRQIMQSLGSLILTLIKKYINLQFFIQSKKQNYWLKFDVLVDEGDKNSFQYCCRAFITLNTNFREKGQK